MLQKINKYFFSNTYGPLPLATLRIGTGLIILLQFIQLLPDMNAMLSNNGIIRQDLVSLNIPDYIISISSIVAGLSHLLHITTATATNFVFIIYVLSMLLLISGSFTRIASILCLLLHLSFVYSTNPYSYGADFFINILLFYCCISPCGKAYSIDSLLFKNVKQVNSTPFVRLMQLHLCMVYCISGICKAVGTNWWNGMSIWKAINRPGVSHYNITYLSKFYWAFAIIGIATLLIEALYPILVNLRISRKFCLACVCTMHISIALVLHLPFFAAVMVLFNVCAFYYPENATATNKELSIKNIRNAQPLPANI